MIFIRVDWRVSAVDSTAFQIGTGQAVWHRAILLNNWGKSDEFNHITQK
jgi:hypothetical protein